MQKPLLLLVAFLILVLLVTTIGKMSPANLAGPGLDLLIYFLVLIISIISLLTGVYQIIRGKKSFISFLHIFFSIIVFALAYYEVTKRG
jgi:hypothetical protein